MFQSRPLSPQSAETFLSPSFSFEPKTELTVATPLPPAPPPAPPSPPPSCVSSAPPASTSRVASAPSPASPSPPFSPPEPQHDVSYFRAVMASETERLTGLSELWETRFDDSSVPEEMRDQMRTAVGQARLLMKERFGQFRGLVDDCDLGRGEKITTCSDLQGFWDMVYFQVEDVNKKFNALKEAESRGWHEETKTVTKQKKVLKKPPVAGSKPGAGGGASAAAKSRLAAVKAAMKARQAAVEQASGAAGVLQGELAPDAAANTAAAQTVMFHGGFFQVESPAKVVGAVRRSSRLSAAPLPQPSPRVSKFGTPGRLHRSTVISRASPLPHVTIATPAKVASPTATPDRTSRSPPESFPCSPKPPPISPTRHALAPVASPRVSHAEHDTPDSDFATAPADAPVSQSPEIQAHSCPHQPEATLPLHLPEQLCTVPEEATPESDALTESSHEQAEEPVVPELVAVHPATDASPVRSGSPGLSRSPPVSTTFPPQVESLDRQASAPSSPCMMSSTPQVLSPAPSDNAALPNGERSPISANLDMTESPHVECVADLDFERYLQPAAFCSLSAVQSPAVERFSLGAGDVEMESPLSQAEESGQEVQMTPTALPRMAPLVFTSRD
uniref:Discs, large (Drosophila) homolog-associated protein 5 n=2 Tax=Electrophorus electricus TaxID=8005 RepID=A0A4W4FAZ5_ELEEL